VSHSTLKIQPGVNTNETPVLNQAAISACNLIRFKPDKKGLGLVEKLGGWAKFFVNQMPLLPRALWAWEDLDADPFLAIGMESPNHGAVGGQNALGVMVAQESASGTYTGTSFQEITPLFLYADVAVNFSTSAGNSLVSIYDSSGPTVTVFDTVYVAEQVSIGGLNLFGLYPIKSVSGAGAYQIQALSLVGAPQAATATVSNAGAVASITTILDDPHATVTLASSYKKVGDTFTVLVPTTIGGNTFYGDYVVVAAVDADHFTISAATSATSVATGSINGGQVRLIYSIGGAPISAATGYGVGGYGQGGYGTGSTVTVNPGTPTNSYDWALGNWGTTLLASPEGAIVDGVPLSGIYQWTPDSGQQQAIIIPQAPPVNDGFFVAMPQRQVVCWGSSFTGIQDPLLVRWCDVNDFTSWIATVANQAGSYRLSTGSRIVGGLQTSQQGLLWTDIGIWSMQYISQPYIYGFNEISTGCGLLAQKGCGILNGVAYWIGRSQFYRLGSDGVSPLDCTVWDVVFQDLDLANADKIRFAANSLFNEVSWFYPSKSGGTGENDSYVKYNAVMDVWDYGKLARSAWINQSVAGPPIGTDPNSYFIYQHEISPDADTQPMQSWFTTGFFSLSDADVKTFIDEVWPDMKWGYYGGQSSATVKLTFTAKDFPSAAAVNIGPFNLSVNTTFISPRVRARLVQITLLSDDYGTFWRIGGMRYRGSADGRY
jgi:hypothetical protein